MNRTARHGTALSAAVGSVGALLAWLTCRGVIDHVPVYDELLHYLAAGGLLSSGKPVIDSGLYTRAELFTVLVARSCEWFGHSLIAARLPALIATMLLAGILAGWLTRRIGTIAGLTAALGLCLVPNVVDMAVFIRFYAVHALLVTAATIAVFEATVARNGRRIALYVVGAALLLLAWQFQPTTLIAAVGLAAAVTAVHADERREAVLGFCKRHRGHLLLVAAAAAVLVPIAAVRLHVLQPLREVPLWAAWAANDYLYYIKSFAQSLPLLWPLSPIAAIPALKSHRRLSLFSLTALAVVLAIHSVAAAKAMRYVLYAVPLLCIVWACALDGLLQWLDSPAAGALDGPVRSRRTAAIVAVALVLGLSTEGQRMARLLLARATPEETLSYAQEPDWTVAVGTLRPLAAQADRVVTSNAMKALYYLGRYDYELNVSIVAETDTHADFGRDERTGRQAIGSADAVTRVVRSPGRTLVVLENRKLDLPVGVPLAAHTAISAACSPLLLPAGLAISAWQCLN